MTVLFYSCFSCCSCPYPRSSPPSSPLLLRQSDASVLHGAVLTTNGTTQLYISGNTQGIIPGFDGNSEFSCCWSPPLTRPAGIGVGWHRCSKTRLPLREVDHQGIVFLYYFLCFRGKRDGAELVHFLRSGEPQLLARGVLSRSVSKAHGKAPTRQ